MPFKVILNSRWDLYAWLGHFTTYFSKFWMRIVWAGNLRHWQSNRKDINDRQKSLPFDSVQNVVLAIKWYCLSSPTVLLLVFFQVADASYLLIMQKQAARNETPWKRLWNTSASAAYAIQLNCQCSLEISDEITIKPAITICVSYFTRPLLWVSCGFD